jgi:DNA primase
MKRFVEIEYHDYMDLRPNTEVRVFEGTNEESLEKNVNDFVAHMKSHWCSGTTRLMGIMEQPEALIWIEQQIAMEHANWQDDSQEFIDKITSIYKECYEDKEI